MNRLEPIRKLQIGKMNIQLRNALWNVIYDSFFHKRTFYSGWSASEYPSLFEQLYDTMFNVRIDDFQIEQKQVHAELKKRFFKLKWNEVYDLIEFIAENLSHISFKNKCNKALEREFSGYRFIGNQITPISNDEELKEIEAAIMHPVEVVTVHIKKSLALM